MITPIIRLRSLRSLRSEDHLDALISVMLQPRYTYDELIRMSDRVKNGFVCVSWNQGGGGGLLVSCWSLKPEGSVENQGG